MMSLNIGYNSKRQGDEPYSSVGASCNLAVEASDDLIKNPEALQAEMARLFEEVKAAVNQQIANGNGNGNGKVATNGNGKTATNGNGSRIATEAKIQPQVEPAKNGRDQDITPKQRQFLVSLVQKRFQGGMQAFEQHLKEEGITSIAMLTRKQASAIIDSLAGKNGGGR